MLYQPESANKLIKSKSVLCAAHLLVMDGYEDLPILLSVIQSNKVNIYCIYIKNYPGIEWRRVAFIGVFPGVKSPRMGARGEEESAGARVPNLFKPLRPPLPPPRAVPPLSLCPRPRDSRAAACRAAKASRAAVKTEARSPDHSQGDRPEEIWGVSGERETGGGTASLCLLSGYIIF